jgi:hypothetical protein
LFIFFFDLGDIGLDVFESFFGREAGNQVLLAEKADV